MRQRNRTNLGRPTNDNAPLGVTEVGPAAGNPIAHVYVKVDEQEAPYVYVPSPARLAPRNAPDRAIRNVWAAPVIVTNLPERLPILPEEVALIRGFMGDLVSRILANDNEPK